MALYWILNGRAGPSRWHRDTPSSAACKFLGQGISLARSNWYEFRNRCGKFLNQVHAKLVGLAIDEKLVTGRECSLDGTFTAATASRHKSLISSRSTAAWIWFNMHPHPRESSEASSQEQPRKIPGWVAKLLRGVSDNLKCIANHNVFYLRNSKKIGNVRPIIERRKQDCCESSGSEIAAVVATSTM